jgi:hypothetical protein
MERDRWPKIVLQYHPREEATQVDNVKDGTEAETSRKVKF